MAQYLNGTDMIDGGGPGRSGDRFEGGALSEFLNSIGIRPHGYRDRQGQGMVVSGMEAPSMAPQASPRPQARPQMAPEGAPQGNGQYAWPTGQGNALAFLGSPEGYQWGQMPQGVRPDYQFQPMDTNQGNALAYMVPTDGGYQMPPAPEDRDRVIAAYQQLGPFGAAQALGLPIETVMSFING